MKKALFLLSAFAIISLHSYSQTVYLADTAFTTDVGYGGAPASCIAPHMLYNGWDNDRSQYQWVADVFTVPADSIWVFDTVIVYEIKYNTTPSYTFLNCNLQIYDGTPGLGGSVIWGDTVTNLISSTGFTGIYKVDTQTIAGGLMSTERPIMFLKLYLSPAPQLSAGTYWLSWSAAGPGTNITYSPDKILPGRVNLPGQMARGQYGGAWEYLTDSGNDVGLNMIIKSSANLSVKNISNSALHILNQNTPNPFNGITSISFCLNSYGYEKLCVFNTLGQLVSTLADGNLSAGNHLFTFNGADLPAGVYYYQLQTSLGIECKQMQLLH